MRQEHVSLENNKTYNIEGTRISMGNLRTIYLWD